MIGRLLELFEGPEAPGPWSPPAMPAPLHSLLPWRAWDESSELYVNAASTGFVLELPPFAGIDAETLGALSGTLADAAPERCTVQVLHWASPRFGAAADAWAAPRANAGGAMARMGQRRGELLAHGGWRKLHAGGPPFTLSDYRVFLTACLASGPGPAVETALGAFRRALEGTLASAGAHARRLEPDALLSLAAELVAPDIHGERDGETKRPVRRWSPRDPLHEQCIAPGRALTVAPTGLTFHHGGPPRSPEGADVAVRVLSAIAFPEVWPGWRGNALIGDFHRDFLQPGAPVLTCLTVVTGDEAAGEKAFLKSARATQQAGTGIARYLPGLPEKARDWQAVTERIKDGEKLVRACYTVAVYAPLDALDEAEQAVRAIYHGQGWRVNAERYVQLPSWLACLPMASAGGLDSGFRAHGPDEDAAHLLGGQPGAGARRVARPARQSRQPAGAAADRAKSGQPACWSPFANDAGNYNVAVTGKSGSGKSVLMQELVTGLIGAGGEAVVIDDGRSFQHTAEALDGAFIAFGKDAATLNPFAMIDGETANRDGDYREECFAMLAGVIGRMCRRRGGIDDIEAALIDEAIAAAWDEAGNGADLGTVQGHLAKRDDRRAKDMATALGPWCPGGAMGRLFAGDAVPDLDNALTVFELGELKGRGDVQGVVLMLVVFLATQRMYHGPRTRAKAIVIDEAWDLLSGEDSRTFLEGAARRARKYRGALVTGTQSVNDYYANPAARAAWENSDWVIFLAQKDESVELLKQEKRIHCDPGMERALKSLTTADGRYAELVLHGPDGWRVARLVLDAWSVALFSSRGPAFAAVENLKAEGPHHASGHRPSRRGRSSRRGCSPGRRRRGHWNRRNRSNGNGRKFGMTVKTAGTRGRAEDGKTGRPLAWPEDPAEVAVTDIDFEALAHVLANCCRRGGHMRHYHSLAAHAVIVSEEIEALDGLDGEDRRTLALHALVAGAESAWFRGISPFEGEWAGSARAAEPGSRPKGRDRSRTGPGRAARLAAGIEAAVREAAGLDPALDEERAELLRFVGRMAAAAESRDLLEAGAPGAGIAFPPLKRRIRPLPPDRAAEAWLKRFRALGGKTDRPVAAKIAADAGNAPGQPDAGET